MNLNDLQRDKLLVLIDDEVTLKALKIVLDSTIERYRPTVTGDDSVLGQQYRAYETAKAIIADGFHELTNLKTIPDEEEKENPGV